MAVSAEAEIPSQFGRSAVVTGATGGLGCEMALALARAGPEVILTGRDDRKGLSAIGKILREVSCARIRRLFGLDGLGHQCYFQTNGICRLVGRFCSVSKPRPSILRAPQNRRSPLR